MHWFLWLLFHTLTNIEIKNWNLEFLNWNHKHSMYNFFGAVNFSNIFISEKLVS